MRKLIDVRGFGSMPLGVMRPGVQGGVSTANLQEALGKGLSAANLAAALGNNGPNQGAAPASSSSAPSSAPNGNGSTDKR